jgi:hypothetical protein
VGLVVAVTERARWTKMVLMALLTQAVVVVVLEL